MPNNELEKRLWTAADQLRANSGLKASEYSVPVLGLIFLRYADEKFEEVKKRIQNKRSSRRRRGLSKEDYQAEGAVYLPDNARFSYLLNLPEDEDIGKKINDAMKAVEDENEELRDVLPVNYQEIDNTTLASLLKILSDIPGIEGDAFGKIYEYFLGGFARSEGARGGEFFTPTSLVKLIVEIIEPYSGRIYDPASGSGGMFVQSARFVERHRKNPGSEISIFGQEKTAASVRLCKLNLAVHGLGGDIRQGNSYYDDPFNSIEKFDFVMANPPFNVNGVDKEKIKSDKRFRYGIPRTDNANYLWIQLFYTALNENGRAGFVMANSASDARQSEQEIRQRLIEDRAVDVMISISSNFFYTVTLPCTLWFFDKGKKKTKRKDKVLFIDARNIYTQVDRALREFTTEQIEFVANIARLYREEELETTNGSSKLLKEHFPKKKYGDVPGLCKVVTIDEIKEQGWSLNPGRYVGVAEREDDEVDFKVRLEGLHEEFEKLTVDARYLEENIIENIFNLLKK
jgi:type I restriction enzyme M protein